MFTDFLFRRQPKSPQTVEEKPIEVKLPQLSYTKKRTVDPATQVVEPEEAPKPKPTALISEAPTRERITIEAPLIIERETVAPSDIRIKAQVSQDQKEIKLMASRPLFQGFSWWFADVTAAQGSHLAEGLFTVPGVASVLIHNSTVTVMRVSESLSLDAKEIAKQLGAVVRAHLLSGKPAVSPNVTIQIPEASEIKRVVQKVIDEVINPGVASHDGKISLEKLEGNSVHIKMGGGCQGCSIAGNTLKFGIMKSIREKAPYIGAIVDETDHEAGLNPYFA